MLRMGGDISGSLFIANGMQGRDIVSGGQNPTVTGNVFVGTADQCLPQRTGGITIVSSGGNYEKNVFANQSVGGVAIEVDNPNKVVRTQPHPWNMTITANTVATTYSGGYHPGKHDSVNDTNNNWSSAGAIKTLEQYAESIGLPPTGDALLAAMRANRMGSWNPQLTAQAILAFILSAS